MFRFRVRTKWLLQNGFRRSSVVVQLDAKSLRAPSYRQSPKVACTQEVAFDMKFRRVGEAPLSLSRGL